MSQDIGAEELQRLLRVPELSLHSGVLCIGLSDGTAVRIIGYSDWLRVEHLDLHERQQCFQEDG